MSSVRSVVTRMRNPDTRASVWAALSLPFASDEENTGVNAEVRAPSATKLRKRFGIRNATKKASAKIEVPRSLATSRSRTKPKILLRRVRADTIAVPRKSTGCLE
jgi:hypothetical protein